MVWVVISIGAIIILVCIGVWIFLYMEYSRVRKLLRAFEEDFDSEIGGRRDRLATHWSHGHFWSL